MTNQRIVLFPEMAPSTSRFSTSRAGHVVTVTVAGSGTKPVMDPEFFAELEETFTRLDAEQNTRAIVIRGVGGQFSFGLDLNSAVAAFARDKLDSQGVARRAELLELIRSWQAAITAVANCRTPTIAAIEGWCVGGGVDLAAACDVRLATADAVFSVREARMAMVADLGSLQRLVGIIGDGHLRELALTGDDIGADHALRIGLINRCAPDAATLIEDADGLAQRIAANSPLVTKGIKDVLDSERAPRVEAGLRYTALWNSAFLLSEDLVEAFQSFVERRRPQFEGR